MTEVRTTGGPKCPNHVVPLLSIGEKGRMQCPVSTAIFEVETDDTQKKTEYDVYGNPIITYKIEGDENG